MSGYINIKLDKFITNLFRNIPQNPKFVNKKQILDPIGSIITLGILSFKPRGTKISITNNRIIFQEPTILQGTFRWSNGDTRLDLHNLCEPIKNAVKWYDINNVIIQKLFEFAKNGLINLKSSYDDENSNSNLVCHSISHYVDIICEIQETIDKSNKSKNIFIQSDVQNHTKIEKLKKVWNKNEIYIVFKMLELIENYKESNMNYSYLLESLMIILDGKEKQSCVIINDIITSID